MFHASGPQLPESQPPADLETQGRFRFVGTLALAALVAREPRCGTEVQVLPPEAKTGRSHQIRARFRT